MELNEAKVGRTVKYAASIYSKFGPFVMGTISYIKKPYIYIRISDQVSLKPMNPHHLDYVYENESENLIALNIKLDMVYSKINKFRKHRRSKINDMILDQLAEDRENILRNIFDIKNEEKLRNEIKRG